MDINDPINKNILELYTLGLQWDVFSAAFPETSKSNAEITRQQLCEKITDEEIIKARIYSGEPFLDEVCRSYMYMSELLKYLWSQSKFQPYWDNLAKKTWILKV